MKIESLNIKENEYNGKKFYQLYIKIDGKDYLLGTLRDRSYDDKEILYINCVHKEFKKNS